MMKKVCNTQKYKKILIIKQLSGCCKENIEKSDNLQHPKSEKHILIISVLGGV